MSEAFGESGMDYTQLPKYQRLLQKLMTASPNQRAVVNTAWADRAMAGEQAQKEMQAMEAGWRQKARDKSLDLAQRRLDLSQSIFDERNDMVGDQNAEANRVAAVGVGTHGVLGSMQGDLDRQRARRLELLAAKFGGEGGVA
ncbi:MAG: hypothetical protein KKE73_10955 [Proteobacteria bacterium]|nr:hypothetical protein [Pseudomonadota bacterium]